LSSGVVELLLTQRFAKVNQQAFPAFHATFHQDSMATDIGESDLSLVS
jgi:hypothetical protein